MFSFVMLNLGVRYVEEMQIEFVNRLHILSSKHLCMLTVVRDLQYCLFWFLIFCSENYL